MDSIFNLIAKSVRLGYHYKDTYLKKKLFLEKSHNWTPNEIKIYQNYKIKQLIRYSNENVPYYHRLFKNCSIDPHSIKNENDLLKIPILTKEDINKHYNDLFSINYPKSKMKLSATSGSTGKPMKFCKPVDSWTWHTALADKAFQEVGYVYGDKSVALWGASFELDEMRSRMNPIKLALTREHFLDCFTLNNSKLDRFYNFYSKFRPKILRGYVTGLVDFAIYCKNHNLLHFPSVIITGAETLLPFQRKIIEETFHCKVFNGYGCREITQYSIECNYHDGLHFSEETAVVSVNSDQNCERNPGSKNNGELIFTDLINYAFPMIRYKNGDVGVLSSSSNCQCGNSHRKIVELEGRVSDHVITPKNRILNPIFFMYLFYKDPKHYTDIKGIKHYQVVQENEIDLSINIVIEENYEIADFQYILENFKRFVGDGMQFNLYQTTEIELSRSGKRRIVISKITKNISGDIIKKV